MHVREDWYKSSGNFERSTSRNHEMSCLRNKLKLRLAAREGDTATARTLLSTRGAQSLINYKDASGATPLFFAAENGHDSVTEQLIAARCGVDLQKNTGSTPLYIAAEKGHACVTEQLIAARCNVDLRTNYGATPLLIAAENGHASVTKQLIAACCKIDLQDETWLARRQHAHFRQKKGMPPSRRC
jgi:ankyrin repeat protein